jgi:hypothetical protein
MASSDAETRMCSFITSGNDDTVLRCRGGGGDGGSTGAESRSCYLEMYKGKQHDKVDPAQQRHARWTQCSYSGHPLTEPIVADEGGALYNKQDLIEGLAAKAANGGQWPKELAHIRLKELLAVWANRDKDSQGCRLLYCDFSCMFMRVLCGTICSFVQHVHWENLQVRLRFFHS